ncbi:hypothetical protein ESCO_005467 [Escovopsis weberi]|uniref:Perilipin MPL1-like protein n=1 Tax=Escovopsis weberi TaxID=150374 RepID=A0A0M8N5J3_ESCWE|nr:hypothetical protein ESCO_005467 [Escovopsis weberi]
MSRRQVNGVPAQQVNGDVEPTPHSASLRHLLSYPVVSDSVETVKALPIAQRSFQMGDTVYKSIAVPMLPLLERPYGYVSPYIERADAYVDKQLDRVDERFPVTKKQPSEIYNETRELALFPVNKAFEGKDHVLDVYASEFKKMDQPGYVAQGKAAVITAFVVVNEVLAWFSGRANQQAANASAPPAAPAAPAKQTREKSRQ